MSQRRSVLKVKALSHVLAENNCALLYGLDFCSDVAYAVPSNPNTIKDFATLQNFYNDNAKSLYVNFSKSLAQIACNTTASAQYSLAADCHDCERAYKEWLCAVTIPRCDDSSKNADGLQYLQRRADPSGERNLTRQSRYGLIDEVVQPGIYNELLPCQDLCYGLVRSCPATLGFSCPLEGHGLEDTYGKLKNANRIDQPSCNFPGRDARSIATALASSLFLSVILPGCIMIWSLVG